MKQPKNRVVRTAIVVMCAVVMLTGCAKVRDFFSRTKGSLVGNDYVISFYDDYGSKTLSVKGDRVDVGVFEENSSFFSEEEETGAFPSEVIEITIDKNQMMQVGNTVIFAQKGLEMVEDFEMSDNIETNSGFGFMGLDRFINDLQNQFGKEKIVVISSQMGIPIGVYEGNKVYVSVPEELPKMTRLNIDGKSLYIHRANYIILDRDMLN